MKHSDVQEKFSTGAKRDTQAGKLRYDLISPMALQRLAVIYTHGAQHYGDRNWEKGMPFTRVMASLQRHLFAFILGDESEDHLAQMVWNGVALLHFQEAIKHGLLSPTLNDMPRYQVTALEQACRDILNPPAEITVDPAEFHKPEKQGDGQNVRDYCKLVGLGCPPRIARQIVGGTTYHQRVELPPDQYVYVAGPMRGYDKFNFPAFDAARDAFLAKGFNVISPADIDRYANPETEQVEKVDVSDQTTFVLRDFWANFFIKKIDCGRNGIVLLTNWAKSTGAAGEFFLDRWLNLKAYKPDGDEYPIDTAKHDYALAHSTVTLQCAIEPVAVKPLGYFNSAD